MVLAIELMFQYSSFFFRMVDNEILNILRQRFEDCVMYEQPDHERKCRPFLERYEKGAENWFIKCKWQLIVDCNWSANFTSTCTRW